ncbi:hypothetical protein [Histidinibacterium aquaticum]|uniref:Uncharacterized protein n=1 Tax=Histidinibacterium aquaticum TaxID=2613962 RepID=A0A5J5GRI1_9RHOB|nr:hypothetical protein [Histidinibacterium aquaticum]KAA9010168.1 hypothetical protein F3S47_02645 [Histidinibacterium aquaticum]
MTQYADDAKAQRGFGRSAYRSGLDDAPSIPARSGVTTPAQGHLDSTPGGYGNIQTPQEARAWEVNDQARRQQLGANIGAAINSAGEMMTMGLVGDEAAGRFDQMIGRGDADERTEFYRRRQEELREEAPAMAITADTLGAILGPGKGASAVINGARTVGGRLLRGAGVGAASGATMGAMEGEDTGSRVMGGAIGAGVGALGGGAVTGIGEGFSRAARALSRNPVLREAVPTMESLKEASQRLYAAVDRSGGSIPGQSVTSLARGSERALRAEGYHPRLHPRLSVVLDEMDEMARRGAASMSDMQILRRIAGNAASSLDPDERRLAMVAIDRIDDTVEELSDQGGMLREARQLWARMSRLGRIESIIDDASNYDNFERTLQSRFRTLLRNPRNLRGFSDEEVRLMRSIAQGGAGVKTLRGLGRLFSLNSLPGVAITGGATYAAGPTALALPAAGWGVGKVADAMVRRRGNSLRDAVASTDHRRAIVEALMRRSNPAAPAAGASPAGLMSYQGGR